MSHDVLDTVSTAIGALFDDIEQTAFVEVNSVAQIEVEDGWTQQQRQNLSDRNLLLLSRGT